MQTLWQDQRFGARMTESVQNAEGFTLTGSLPDGKNVRTCGVRSESGWRLTERLDPAPS